MKKYKGFIEPVIDNTHWFLGSGASAFEIFVEDGNWKKYLPEGELQSRNGIETFNCTGFNTLNAIETLEYRITGIRPNYSDRWLGIMAGTSAEKGGNDPHTVAEAIRKYGLIPEEMLPFTEDIKTPEEYYSFKGGDEKACREAAQKWLNAHEFTHDWVFKMEQPIDEKIQNMKTALKSSPLALSVFAWSADQRGVYVSLSQANHWTSMYSLGEFLNIFDSYDPFLKLVEQNSMFCKRYSIKIKEFTPEKKSLFIQVLRFLKSFFGLDDKQIETVEAIINKPADHYEEVKEIMKNRLEEFCLCIRDYEGKPGDLNYKNNNPGNARCSSKGYLSKYGNVKCVNNFAVFPTYELGWLYLQNLVKSKITEHPEWTILDYISNHAPKSDGNNPLTYANYISARMKLPITTKVKDFI